MGNSFGNDQDDVNLDFALPQQQIVHENDRVSGASGSAASDPRVSRAISKNVVPFKVITLENLRFKRLTEFGGDYAEHQLTATLSDYAPGLKVELYLFASLENFQASQFPAVQLHTDVGQKVGVRNQGPMLGRIEGKEVTWDIMLKPQSWPLDLVGSADIGMESNLSPITIILTPPSSTATSLNVPTPEGSGLYVYFVSPKIPSVSLALRLVQTPTGITIVNSLFGMDGNDAMCIYCLTEPRTTAVVPCHHLCLCDECLMTIQTRVSEQGQKCPICRQSISGFMRLNFQKEKDEQTSAAAAALGINKTVSQRLRGCCYN